MADNTTLDPGAGGDTIATDDIGGIKHQQVKVEFGADGTATPVSAADPLPVTAIASALPTGAATAAKQDTGNTSLASIDGKITAVNTGAVVVASSALPTGASTAARQDTGNTSLASIDGKITAVNTGAVVVSSSALPTGASTAAKQPALGTAGTASTDVITVQGIASMTPIATTAVGTVADDATTPGAPVMVGGSAKSPDGTDPSSVAENDVARSITDLNRRVYVNTNHPRALHKHLNGTSAYTDESIAADPGDGFQIVITSIIGSTGAATALNFFLEEGSTTIFGPIYLEAVAGRGFASGPIYLPITASTAVTLTSSAAIAQSFDIDYFIQAV